MKTGDAEAARTEGKAAVLDPTAKPLAPRDTSWPPTVTPAAPDVIVEPPMATSDGLITEAICSPTVISGTAGEEGAAETVKPPTTIALAPDCCPACVGAGAPSPLT